MENPEVAQVFEEVADLLDIQGENPFRVRAYRNAARMIRDLAAPLAQMSPGAGVRWSAANVGHQASNSGPERRDWADAPPAQRPEMTGVTA